jgi:hypothetical protein
LTTEEAESAHDEKEGQLYTQGTHGANKKKKRK